MVTRMSKTGAIYYEEPFTQAELEERQRSEGKVEPAAKAIALERFEAGRHAFVAVAGDVQIGWCIRRDGGWYIEDTDGHSIAGPFRTLASASTAGQEALAYETGETNGEAAALQMTSVMDDHRSDDDAFKGPSPLHIRNYDGGPAGAPITSPEQGASQRV